MSRSALWAMLTAWSPTRSRSLAILSAEVSMRRSRAIGCCRARRLMHCSSISTSMLSMIWSPAMTRRAFSPSRSSSASPSAKNALRKQQRMEMKRYWQQRQVDGLRAAIANVAPDSEPKLPDWKRQFEDLRRQSPVREQSADWPPGKEILYVLRTATRIDEEDLAIEIEARARKKNGQWSKPRPNAVGYQT